MAFDFEIDIHGARIVTTKEPLTTASLYEPEIDNQVERLKNELDAVAKRMKAAIRKQENQPLFGDS